jgi:hypothetical protein
VKHDILAYCQRLCMSFVRCLFSVSLYRSVTHSPVPQNYNMRQYTHVNNTASYRGKVSSLPYAYCTYEINELLINETQATCWKQMNVFQLTRCLVTLVEIRRSTCCCPELCASETVNSSNSDQREVHRP